MKIQNKVWLIAIIVLLGFTVVTCDDGNDGQSGNNNAQKKVTWTAINNHTFGNDIIRDITWGDGKFVAVGNNGKMAYSQDGITWTAVTDSTFTVSSVRHYISDIVWGNDKFVAVGSGCRIAYSEDGINWTATNSTWAVTDINNLTQSTISSIIWGNGRFVAVGGGGNIIYSTDGISWHRSFSHNFYGENNNIISLAWGNNIFVAGAISKIPMSQIPGSFVRSLGLSYSSDGISWTSSNFQISPSNNSIAWGNDLFIMMYPIAYSNDGINWSLVQHSGNFHFPSFTLSGLVWGNNKFIIFGRGGMAYWSGNFD